MIIASLECRECELPITKQAFDFEPNEGSKIEDTQDHVKKHFKARCFKCFGCNWEVTEVREAEFVSA